MNNWSYLGTVFDGILLEIEGCNVWDYEWQDSDEKPIMVPHPQYSGQKHKMDVYIIKAPNNREIKFAAGEFSNCVWGFYVPFSNGDA